MAGQREGRGGSLAAAGSDGAKPFPFCSWEDESVKERGESEEIKSERKGDPHPVTVTKAEYRLV